MKEFQTAIYKFLKNHEKHKKYIALLTVLSLIVSMAVPFSLIMPAISMTNDDNNQSDMYLENNSITLLGYTPPAVPAEYQNAVQITNNTETGCTATVDVSDGTDPLPEQITGDSTSIAFNIKYQFAAGKVAGKELADKKIGIDINDKLIIDVTSLKDNLILDDSSKHGDVSDSDPKWKAIDSSGKSGKFEIKDGWIVITLTERYIQYLNEGDGSIIGDLNVSGTLNRDESKDGDQEIYVAGQHVPVSFAPKTKPSLSNKTYNTNAKDGKIEWQLTINNSGKVDLSNYDLTDTMFTSATDVIVNPSEAGSFNNDNKTFTFNQESKNHDWITVTYKTPITGYNKTEPNDAKLKKKGDTYESTKSTNATIGEPFTVEKTGTAKYPVYEEDKDNIVTWTVTVTGNYDSLAGYVLEDAALNGATNVKINNQNYEITGATLSGNTLTLPDNFSGTRAVITYDAIVSNPDANDQVKNTVTVREPKEIKEKTTNGTVTYQKKSDLISFEKNGSYDLDTHEITWTVTVRPTGNISLKGYELSDSQFPNDINKFNFDFKSTSWVTYNGQSINVNEKYKDYITVDKGKLNFGDFGSCITNEISFSYKTSVPVSDLPESGTKPVSNDIGDNNHTTTTKVTAYVSAKRNELDKRVAEGNTNREIENNQTITETIKWQVDLTYDDSFAGKTYTDTLSVADNNEYASHTFNEDSIVVKAKQKNGDGYDTIDSSKYTLTKTSNGFTVKFNDTFDAKYNYVQITYDTTATILANAPFDKKCTFKNEGSGFGSGGIGTCGITKKDPEKNETLDLTVNKAWNNDSDSVSDRPAKVYIKVLKNTKTGSIYNNYDNENWTQQGNTIELTSSNSWSTVLNDLLKSETKADPATGKPRPTVYYYYKIVEVDENGNEIKYIDTANGIYKVINSNIETNNTTTLSATNEYHGDIDITAKKNWTGTGENSSSRQPITVHLEYDDGSGWKTVSGTEKILNDGNSWSFTFSDQPTGIYDTTSNTFKTYKYRIVETKFGDTAIGDNNKNVIVSDGYYVCNIYSDKINNNDISSTGTYNITNVFHKTESLTIGGNKIWNDAGYTDNRPDTIIVQLQRQTNGQGEWVKLDEKNVTVDKNNNEQTIEAWSSYTDKDGKTQSLVSQSIDPNTKIVTTYKYRIIEVGYKIGSTEYRFNGNTKFATRKSASGEYEGYYESSHQDNNNNTTTITNTFHSLEPISINPQKKWENDSDILCRPKSVKFKLKQKLGNGEWLDAVDCNGNEVADITLSANDVIDNNNTTWSKTISNLPQSKIVSNNPYTEQTYQYQFVEVGYTDSNDAYHDLTDGATFFNVQGKKADNTDVNGKYKIEYPNNPVGSNNATFEIKNTFEVNIGVDKVILKDDLTGGQKIIPMTKEELQESGYKIKLKDEDGNDTDYYVFNWVISFDTPHLSASTVDQLPDGFTLIEAENMNDNIIPWNFGDGRTGVDFSSLFDPTVTNYCKDGYFYRIYMVYSDKANNAASRGVNAVNSKPKQNVVNIKEEGYYYDKAENRVYFSEPRIDPGVIFQICYATKIKCSDLEKQIEEGKLDFMNHVVKLEDDGTETKDDDEAGIMITSKAPADLISKTYHNPAVLDENGRPADKEASIVKGEMNFSLDVNPDGKNLSNGETIDIEDIFKTESYTVSDTNYNKSQKLSSQTGYGPDLVDILMKSVKVSEVDANGVKTPLSKSEYTIQFDNNGANSNGEQGAALVKLTVPDEKHIVIDYTYKLLTNDKTPSVLNKCRVRIDGKTLWVEKGFDIPGGDSVKFNNKAKLISDSASSEDSTNSTEYKISTSGASISTNTLPKIKKVNIGNVDIDNLNAKFLLARYDELQQKWFYAKTINEGKEIIDWTEGAEGLDVNKDAVEINVNTGYSYQIALSKSALYKLVEVKVPQGYEGSNLGLTDEQFKNLIIDYLNDRTQTKITLNGKETDYSTFLNKYVPVYYFVYNGVVSSYPSEVDQSKVIQVMQGADIEIPNNELIDIGVSKKWNDGDKNENDKIKLALYWSYKKSSTGIPDDAVLATAEDLGIMDIGVVDKDKKFSAIQEKTMKELQDLENLRKEGKDSSLWYDLPNGKDGKSIYYYVKETAYTIDGKTYTLVDGENNKENENYGKYVSEDKIIGEYYPTYVGNAANSDTIIEVKNSKELKLIKLWKDSSNNPLPERKITAKEIKVNIYGTTKDIDGIPGTGKEEKLLENIVLTPDAETGKWELDITDFVNADSEYNVKKENIDLSLYKSFRAEEINSDDFKVDDYVVSCVFNLNKSTGAITITNKKIGATSASVTVNKEWSDGVTVHEKDSISVSLYRSTTQITDLSNLTAEKLNQAGAEKMTDTKYTVTLDNKNNWTYTWIGLPLDNEDEVTSPEAEITKYYYYVLEDMSGVVNSDKYTAIYTFDDSSSNTKTVFNINNNRKSIVAQKEWRDENNQLIEDVSQMQDIQLKVYKKIASIPEGTLNIVALGDSITRGSFNDLGGNFTGVITDDNDSGSYPAKLRAELIKKGYNVEVDKQGVDSQQILSFKERFSSITSDTDIVCLLGGTNDIHQSGDGRKNPDECIKRLKELIEGKNNSGGIKQQNPNAIILVGSIPHFDFTDANGNPTRVVSEYWWPYGTTEDEANGYIDQYNTLIKEYVDSGTVENLYFVDVCSAVDKDTMIIDGCHPNADGYTEIAKAYYNAIDEIYSTKNYVSDEIITLNSENNWTASIDVPEDGEYSVEEINVPDGWLVSYDNNGQQAGSKTSIMVINKEKAVPKTSISVEKKWIGDLTDTSARDNIILNLYQGIMNADGTYTWTPYDMEMPDPTGNDTDIWTYVYEDLPAVNSQGNRFSYKVVEEDLPGYSVTYGTNEENGLASVSNGSAGTLHITNVRMTSLKVQKVWSDGNAKHVGDIVKVKVYRSTKENSNSDAKLIFAVNPSGTVNMAKDSSQAITANRSDVTYTSSDETVAKVENGEIKAVGAGNAVITAKSGNEEIKITVNVVALNFTITPNEIAIGGTATASLTKSDNSACEGVFYSSSDTTVVTVDSSTGTITAVGAGTATITAEYDGKTITKDITVKLPNTFTLTSSDGSEIALNGTIKLTPDPNYGTFTWLSSDTSKVTVDADGTVHGIVLTAANEEVTITATRNDGKTAEFKVTVVENPDFILYGDGIDVTNIGNTHDNRFKINNGETITFTSNKEIVNVVSCDNHWLKVTYNTGEQSFEVGSGVGGVNDYGKYFTITYKDGNQNVEKQYYVEIVAFTPLRITAPSQLAFGDSCTLSSNKNNTTYDIISGQDLIERNGNTITAKSQKGTVKIKATCGDETAECTIEIAPAPWTLTVDDKDLPTEIKLSVDTSKEIVSNYPVTVSGGDGKVTLSDDKKTITINAGSSAWSEDITITREDDNTQSKPVKITVQEGSLNSGTINGKGTIYFAEDNSKVNVESIVFENVSLSNGPQCSVVFYSDYYAGQVYIENYGNLAVNSIQNCTATLNGTTVTISGFKVPISRIEFGANGMTANYTFTLADVQNYSLMSFAPVSLKLDSEPAPVPRATERTWTSNEKGEYTEIEITASGEWEYVLEDLAVMDSSNSNYYYWVEETEVSLSYEVSYRFEDGDEIGSESDKLINAGNAGTDPTAVIKNIYKESKDTSMPSTGGEGTEPYKVIGLIVACGALTLLGVERRRKRA